MVSAAQDAWAGARAAVTGASGRLGRRVAARLARRGAEVLALDRRPAPGPLPERVETRRLDVADRDALGSELAGCRIVFHLAGVASGDACLEDPAACFDANVGATLSVLAASRSAGVRRFVFASTGLVYAPRPRALNEADPTEPGSPYGASKLAAEACLRGYSALEQDLEFEVVRLSNVYGAGDAEQTVIGRAIAQARGGGPIALEDLSPIRDFLHADDAAEGMVRLAEAGTGRGIRVTNLSTGVGTSVREMAELLIDGVAGRGGPRLTLEEPPAAATGPASLLVLENGALRRRTGWAPRIPLAAGLLAAYDGAAA